MIFLSKSLKEHDLEKDCQTQFLQNHKKNKIKKNRFSNWLGYTVGSLTDAYPIFWVGRI